MSARNKLLNKQARADRRIAKKAANMLDDVAQPVARYGICAVTGRYTIVDLEYGISERGWREIQRYILLVGIEDRLKDKGLDGAVPAERVLEILQDNVAGN